MTLTYNFTLAIVDTATAEVGCTKPLTIDVEEPVEFTNAEVSYCCVCE